MRPDKRRRVQSSPGPVPTLPAPLTPLMPNRGDRQVSPVPPLRHRARVQPGSERRELPRVPAFPALSPTTTRLGGSMRPRPLLSDQPSAQPGSDSGGFTVLANAPTPSPVLAFAGDDAMAVADATLGTHPAPQTQQRKARAARAREARANLSASWARAEEDAEAAVSWSHRMLQDRGARAAMTASLDLWMWPSDGQDSEGHPAGGHGLHETMFDPVARGGLHATGSAGGDGHAEIAIFGGSRARSDGPSDEAIHTMTEADGPGSPPVCVQPAVGGGVGVGAWGPQDGGNGMALDSVTDMAGSGAGRVLAVSARARCV